MAKFPFARVMLNTNKAWNSSFFCPINKCHLTLQSPYGEIYVVTNTIISELMALPMPSIIDINGVIDVKNGCFKDMPEEQEFIIPDDAIVLEAPPVEPTKKKKR